jgi:hypothetical protein
MIEQDIAKARPLGAPLTPADANSGPAAGIVAELDHIVGRSQRRSRLRQALRRVGGAVAHWLDQLVPPAPPPGDSEPPQIRFPFF